MPVVAPNKKIDCLGLFCPMPILKVREAMIPLTPGQVLEMLSADPASEADMKSWTTRTGHELLAVERAGAVFRFLVRKTKQRLHRRRAAGRSRLRGVFPCRPAGRRGHAAFLRGRGGRPVGAPL